MTHSVEVAHDTELLRLLHTELVATRTLNLAVGNLRSAASLGYRNPNATLGDHVGLAGRYADLPDGIIYSTDVRGTRSYETVYFVKTDDQDRPATLADIIAVNPAAGVDPADSHNLRKRLDRYAAAYATYTDAWTAAIAASDAIISHEANYTGWDRYWLVTSSDGHVHRSRNCTTCYDTTRYALIPTLSGGTLDETVALVGPALCSVCYPLAPTDLVDGAKVTGKVAELLLTEGEDAFRAKLAALAAKRAERCAGSGATNHDRAGYDRYHRWAHCPTCGDGVSVTATGKLRAHKPPRKDP